MSFSTGDRVRTNRTVDLGGTDDIPADAVGTVVDEPRGGVRGGVVSVVFDEPSLRSFRPGYEWKLSEFDLRKANEPASVASAEKPSLSGAFSLSGFGLQDLLHFVAAFQDSGEEKFAIEWTLSGHVK